MRKEQAGKRIAAENQAKGNENKADDKEYERR